MLGDRHRGIGGLAAHQRRRVGGGDHHHGARQARLRPDRPPGTPAPRGRARRPAPAPRHRRRYAGPACASRRRLADARSRKTGQAAGPAGRWRTVRARERRDRAAARAGRAGSRRAAAPACAGRADQVAAGRAHPAAGRADRPPGRARHPPRQCSAAAETERDASDDSVPASARNRAALPGPNPSSAPNGIACANPRAKADDFRGDRLPVPGRQHQAVAHRDVACSAQRYRPPVPRGPSLGLPGVSARCRAVCDRQAALRSSNDVQSHCNPDPPIILEQVTETRPDLHGLILGRLRYDTRKW